MLIRRFWFMRNLVSFIKTETWIDLVKWVMLKTQQKNRWFATYLVSSLYPFYFQEMNVQTST